jgi:ATP/maltotriose-dependent transcriptional regulator MalT
MQNGFPDEAISHALASGDFELAEQFMESATPMAMYLSEIGSYPELVSEAPRRHSIPAPPFLCSLCFRSLKVRKDGCG